MNTGDLPQTFGEWLKDRRKALDLSQAELASRAGCSVAGLRKIESGERRPSKELAASLARALEIGAERQTVFVRVARGDLNIERLGEPSAGQSAGGRLPTSQAAVVSLPLSATPFVGRSGELSTLSDLLHDRACRLLTLIGPGGIGKTRLAVEVAAHVSDAFAQGACFVPLALLNASTFLVPALADALGFTFQGQTEARVQLINYLRGRHQLLVLDNVEHLLDGVDLFGEIMARAAGVKLLVTSRERLNLPGEWVYEIGGLPHPGENDPICLEAYSSVTLFMQSARRVRPDFELSEADQLCVARICRLLEGTPLGIELAAAWVFALPPCEIAQQIERNLDFLETSMRGVPERQRSLRAAFNHSWELLSFGEQNVLSRLAAFRGGFTHEAAEQVAGASLASLVALASKSLVRRRETGRFDLHEVVRQYAFAQLAKGPEWNATRDRHSNYFLTLLSNREQDLKGPAQQEVLRQLTGEIGNIRAAWGWAVERGQFALIGEALRGYGWMSEVGGLLREGISELELVVQALRGRELDPEKQAVLGQTFAQQGLLYFRLGEFGRAMLLLEESLALSRPLNNPALLVDALILSGIILHLIGDYGGSLERVREGGRCAQIAGDKWFAVYAHYNIGYIVSITGRLTEGYELMQHSLAAWRAIADPRSTALGLNYLAPTAIYLGRIDEARSYLEESVALCTAVGDRWGLGVAYRHLGLAEMTAGHIEKARAYVNKSLETFSGYITGWDPLQSILYLGRCAAYEGDVAEAEVLYRQALRGALDVQSSTLALEALVELADLRLRAGRAEQAQALALYILTHPSSTYEIRRRAEQIYREIPPSLTPTASLSAEAWPGNRSLDMVAEEILA